MVKKKKKSNKDEPVTDVPVYSVLWINRKWSGGALFFIPDYIFTHLVLFK